MHDRDGPVASPASRARPNWLAIVLYYAMACAISWPLFWRRDMLGQPVPGIVYMWGPGVAALVVLGLFRRSHRRTITLLGTSRKRSVLFYFAPIAALCAAIAAGFVDTGEVTGLTGALMLPFFGLLMILGEELGWRGYLQDALRPLPPWSRYVLIGVMWEAWHFTNRFAHPFTGNVLTTLAITYTAVIVLSWVIGTAADRSRSLLVAVTLHAWANILFEFNSIVTTGIFCLATPFWLYLLLTWDRAARHDHRAEVGPMSIGRPLGEAREVAAPTDSPAATKA